MCMRRTEHKLSTSFSTKGGIGSHDRSGGFPAHLGGLVDLPAILVVLVDSSPSA